MGFSIVGAASYTAFGKDKRRSSLKLACYCFTQIPFRSLDGKEAELKAPFFSWIMDSVTTTKMGHDKDNKHKNNK